MPFDFIVPTTNILYFVIKVSLIFIRSRKSVRRSHQKLLIRSDSDSNSTLNSQLPQIGSVSVNGGRNGRSSRLVNNPTFIPELQDEQTSVRKQSLYASQVQGKIHQIIRIQKIFQFKRALSRDRSTRPFVCSHP